MKLRIEIDLENAAFEDAPEEEVALILEILRSRIRRYGLQYFQGGYMARVQRPVLDSNGNTVGFAEVVED